MDVFGLREHVVGQYADFTRSFLRIHDERIESGVAAELDAGRLWPEPLVQLNPAFAAGGYVGELVAEGLLGPACERIFRVAGDQPMRFHMHQREAIEAARGGRNYVLTTGTGSGKSLAYIVPIVDHVLTVGSGGGIKAVVVYPMNALANSQIGELEKFLGKSGTNGVTFARYTGQERDDEKQAVIADPPDILITNYLMLELLLTRPGERKLIEQARQCRFLVFDELHTYRGRQGSDVALLIRRGRAAFGSPDLQCVGTSATLAGSGSVANQRVEVARIASGIFGAPVTADCVFGETLTRSTEPLDLSDLIQRDDLTTAARSTDHAPLTPESYRRDPVARFIEQSIGVRREEQGDALIRQSPRPIGGAAGIAVELSEATGVASERCEQRIRETLVAGVGLTDETTGRSLVAFRVHQFLSRGDTVFATLEPPGCRLIAFEQKRFADIERSRPLLPLAFCRQCGQDYYPVREERGRYVERELRDVPGSKDPERERVGYLAFGIPDDWDDRVPDAWRDDNGGIKRDRRGRLPREVGVAPDGGPGDEPAVFIPAPFRFCPRCGTAHHGRGSETGRLGTLGSGGRSSATTVLSVAAIVGMRRDPTLEASARKLLCFSDNRQDTSLQAGHFNDFVSLSLLRAAVVRAVQEAGADGLSHELVAESVVSALGLEFDEYSANPNLAYLARDEVDRALRDVTGYRVYADLERGWRFTQPNLEQTGLLRIEYRHLPEISRDEQFWAGDEQPDAALVGATPGQRERLSRALLDELRRSLAINVHYLEVMEQDRIRQRSDQHLIDPWSFDEQESDSLRSARICFPRSRSDGDWRRLTMLVSERSAFGRYAARMLNIKEAATKTMIVALLKRLTNAGLLVEVVPPRGVDDVAGYRVAAAAMRWLPGDGNVPTDPLRNLGEAGPAAANEFFRELYEELPSELRGLSAREHTAAVSSEKREQREHDFQSAHLPVLYCSPTMELGVDVAQLNTVAMRNVPPTPANYAQRSGRAGRSGQPALVVTYCATGSSHDRYYFADPKLMVAGQVQPPALDLANRDLVRSHVHAIWLGATGAKLATSLRDVLDLSDDGLPLHPDVVADLAKPGADARAIAMARKVLDGIEEVRAALWYSDDHVADLVAQAPARLNAACDRWRTLYRAALRTQAEAQKVIVDASATADAKKTAQGVRREAESQLELLMASEGQSRSFQQDFGTYRYLASEGFLPGYSFPRLPLSAFVPGRRGRTSEGEYLQRPRFLAVSEFGPRSLLYHEGSTYRITGVIPAPRLTDEGEDALTTSAKQCEECGYVHLIASGSPGPDVCERPGCGAQLPQAMRSLMRMQNVRTRRVERITSDDEERRRQGFEIRTGVHFARDAHGLEAETAGVHGPAGQLLELTYAPQATIWRANLGERRRKDRELLGFVLNTQMWEWAKSADETDGAPEDNFLSGATRRVVPYVEDTRTALLATPLADLLEGVEEDQRTSALASLAAALSHAVRLEFQLEDSELACEPLPDADNRRVLLFYESAEGGAGVLRRLVDDEDALRRVARSALTRCHVHADHPEDELDGACVAACYDCLMSYGNQREHSLLDRKLVIPLLAKLASASIEASPTTLTRAEHLARLQRLCDSQLERDFLRTLETGGFRLPDEAQALIESAGSRPDFLYAEARCAVFIDGPHHERERQAADDARADTALMDVGWFALRFPYDGDWPAILASNAGVFGEGRA